MNPSSSSLFITTTGFPQTQGGLAMSSANGLDNSNHNFSHDAEIVASAVVDSPPPWLQKDDREVLRYYAYSHEPVYEGGDVNVKVFRVRYFTIYYFTSSGMYVFVAIGEVERILYRWQMKIEIEMCWAAFVHIITVPVTWIIYTACMHAGCKHAQMDCLIETNFTRFIHARSNMNF